MESSLRHKKIVKVVFEATFGAMKASIVFEILHLLSLKLALWLWTSTFSKLEYFKTWVRDFKEVLREREKESSIFDFTLEE